MDKPRRTCTWNQARPVSSCCPRVRMLPMQRRETLWTSSRDDGAVQVVFFFFGNWYSTRVCFSFLTKKTKTLLLVDATNQGSQITILLWRPHAACACVAVLTNARLHSCMRLPRVVWLAWAVTSEPASCIHPWSMSIHPSKGQAPADPCLSESDPRAPPPHDRSHLARPRQHQSKHASADATSKSKRHAASGDG